MQFFLILFLLISQTAWGATQQVVFGGHYNNSSAASTEYFPPTGGSGVSVCIGETSESSAYQVFPADGTITNFKVISSADPDNGAGTQSYKLTIRVNGAEPATPTTCTVSDGATTCSDTTNATTISAGDRISIESVPTNTPTVGAYIWNFLWNPTTDDETIMTGNTGSDIINAGDGARYVRITGCSFDEFDAGNADFIAPTAGVFKNLYINGVTAPGAGNTKVYAFADSAGSETINCTVSGTATTCNSTLETETATATAGERFRVTVTGTSNPDGTIATFGIVFVPTTTGEFIIAGQTEDTTNSTTTEYIQINTTSGLFTATEVNVDSYADTGSLSNDMTIEDIFVELSADIGADSATYAFTLESNTATASALTCTVDGTAGGANKCNFSSSIAMTDGNFLSTKVVPTNTPGAVFPMISYTGYIDPTAEAVEGNTTIYSSTIYNATIY